MPAPLRPDPLSFLPLRPVAAHVLLALSRSQLHGYALLKEVRESSQGTVDVEAGPLYRHLGRLVDDGLIEAAAGSPARDARRGPAYRLTALGRKVLDAEAARLRHLVALFDSGAQKRVR